MHESEPGRLTSAGDDAGSACGGPFREANGTSSPEEAFIFCKAVMNDSREPKRVTTSEEAGVEARRRKPTITTLASSTRTTFIVVISHATAVGKQPSLPFAQPHCTVPHTLAFLRLSF